MSNNKRGYTLKNQKGLIKDIAGYVLCGVLVLFFGGHNIAPIALMIPILFALESWFNKGKVIVNFILIILVISGFPFTALICAFGYILFHVLDPDKFLRTVRMLIALGVVGYALFQIADNNISPLLNRCVGGVTLVAFLNFIWRWTYGTNFRFFPLLFHLLPIGIYLDGFTFCAFVVQICGMYVNFRLYGNDYDLKQKLLNQEQNLLS